MFKGGKLSPIGAFFTLRVRRLAYDGKESQSIPGAASETSGGMKDEAKRDGRHTKGPGSERGGGAKPDGLRVTKKVVDASGVTTKVLKLPGIVKKDATSKAVMVGRRIRSEYFLIENQSFVKSWADKAEILSKEATRFGVKMVSVLGHPGDEEENSNTSDTAVTDRYKETLETEPSAEKPARGTSYPEKEVSQKNLYSPYRLETSWPKVESPSSPAEHMLQSSDVTSFTEETQHGGKAVRIAHVTEYNFQTICHTFKADARNKDAVSDLSRTGVVDSAEHPAADSTTLIPTGKELELERGKEMYLTKGEAPPPKEERRLSSEKTDGDNAPGLSRNVVEVPGSPVGPGADKGSDYKNPEYFRYNRYSYAQAEAEMNRYRLPQPALRNVKGDKKGK